MNATRSTHLVASGGRSFVGWLTGTGFLMLHGACFFLALSILIPWNLYSDPSDFWVADPLRKWAFLLAFQALLVGAWSVAQHVLFPSTDENDPQHQLTPGWRTSRRSADSLWPANGGMATSDPTASSLLAEEWARRWLDTDLARSSGATDDIGYVSSASDSYQPASPAEPQTSNRDPHAWPDAPADGAGARDLSARYESFDDLDSTQPSDKTKPVDIDPLHTAASSSDGDEARSGEDVDADWRWIEAAANAWLTRREQEISRNGTGDRQP